VLNSLRHHIRTL